MCLCQFGQNPRIGSGDRVQTMSNADADADGIRTKSNMLPISLRLMEHNVTKQKKLVFLQGLMTAKS